MARIADARVVTRKRRPTSLPGVHRHLPAQSVIRSQNTSGRLLATRIYAVRLSGSWLISAFP